MADEDLRIVIARRFDNIDRTLGAIEERLTLIEDKLDALEHREEG